jgi:hypothetical protein
MQTSGTYAHPPGDLSQSSGCSYVQAAWPSSGSPPSKLLWQATRSVFPLSMIMLRDMSGLKTSSASLLTHVARDQREWAMTQIAPSVWSMRFGAGLRKRLGYAIAAQGSHRHPGPAANHAFVRNRVHPRRGIRCCEKRCRTCPPDNVHCSSTIGYGSKNAFKPRRELGAMVVRRPLQENEKIFANIT